MIILQLILEKWTKILNYIIYREDYNFINFYYDCPDNNTIHYLFINYNKLDNNITYYYKFHNLIGSEAELAEIVKENDDFQDFEFSKLNKFNYFIPDENHLNIMKLKCSGKGNKILANIIYGKKDNVNDSIILSDSQNINDFNFTFGKSILTVDYSKIKGDKFDIQIFTINGEQNIAFNITFENITSQIINDYSNIFKISNRKYFSNLTIESNIYIETIVSIIIGNNAKERDKINTEYKYFTIYKFSQSPGYLYYYEIEHEFNTNYYIDFEFLLEYNRKLARVCYYIANVPFFHYYGQNCILGNVSESKNISLHNIFKYSENWQNNLDEPK